MLHLRLAVLRRRRETQAFRSSWHCGEVDRLDVDPRLFKQEIRQPFRVDGIADDQGYDMAAVVDDWQPECLETQLEGLGLVLMRCPDALAFPGLQQRDGSGGARRERGRKRRREYEARRIGSYRVAHPCASRDIPTQAPVGLGESAVDDVHAARKSFTLRDATTPCAIHANGMDLINIGECSEFLREVADRLQRAEVAVHGIYRLEGDEFRHGGV